MKDFFIKTVKVGGTTKDHYQVGYMKPTTKQDGTTQGVWFAVSRPFYNKVDADKFLQLMRRNERIYEEKLARERDEFYIPKSRRKGRIW